MTTTKPPLFERLTGFGLGFIQILMVLLALAGPVAGLAGFIFFVSIPGFNAENLGLGTAIWAGGFLWTGLVLDLRRWWVDLAPFGYWTLRMSLWAAELALAVYVVIGWNSPFIRLPEWLTIILSVALVLPPTALTLLRRREEKNNPQLRRPHRSRLWRRYHHE